MIIHQAEIETSTQTKDQIIHDFAFFVFSSSHHESKYIIPLMINEITAIADTNCITCHIILVISSIPILLLIVGAHGVMILESTHPGNHTQLTDGQSANARLLESNSILSMKSFLNIFKYINN